MTTCNTCGEMTKSSALTNGMCQNCTGTEKASAAAIAPTESSIIESLKMNPFSFIQMSGRLNYLVYGFVVPALLVGLAFAIGQKETGLVLVVLAGVMALASFIRRGMDAGITPLTAILSLILSSWVISEVLARTLISFKIIMMSGNFVVGMALVAIIQNIYLVYLLFAPHKALKQTQGSKMGQRIVLGITVVLVLGIIAAVVLPKLQ